MKVEERYLDGSYFASNPDWDSGDAVWKAGQVAQLLNDNRLSPESICEVGCGSALTLNTLGASFPRARLVGYDVSPQASRLWDGPRSAGVQLIVGDFHGLNRERFDVLMLLDVFEHVRDPYSFLEASRRHADRFVFHVPLDLSALSVARQKPLLDVRRRAGHLHSYTKDLALETLADCGYRIVEWRYTGAWASSPSRSLRTRLAQWPRRIAALYDKDLAVRVFGGETLLVLAE